MALVQKESILIVLVIGNFLYTGTDHIGEGHQSEDCLTAGLDAVLGEGSQDLLQ